MIGAGLAILALGAAFDGPDSEDNKEALRKQVREYMEAGKWKKATSAIQKLRRTAKGDEKKELSTLLDRVKGEQEWQKILTARGSSTKPGKLLSMISKFLKKFADDEEIRQRAEDLREEIMGEIVCMLDDFEGGASEAGRGKTALVKDKVKGGEYALQWMSNTLQDDYLYVEMEQTDWSKYDYLCMWIYSQSPQGRLQVDVVTRHDEQWPDRFVGYIAMNRSGWKRIRLPLRGKRSSFSKQGKADWTHIEDLCFEKEEGKRMDIILDEICLEKAR